MIQPKRIGLGDYTPDLSGFAAQNTLLKAENTLPAADGYRSMPSFEAMDETVLGGRPLGAIGGVDPGAVGFNFAGTSDALYRIAGNGTEAVTRDAGAYSVTGAERWEFVQRNDVVIAATYGEPMQYVRLGTPGKFQDMDVVEDGFTPPRGRHIAAVRTHIVLGNCFDGIYGAVPNSIWWSSINSGIHWFKPGGDLAAADQSDRQELAGNGGWVQAVVGGGEVGAVFQEKAIWRMDYRGGSIIYSLTKVEPDRGCLIPGLAIAFGRNVFYLAEDGFYLFDYRTSQPIGKDRVNATFFSDWDSDYPDRVYGIADPDSTQIWVVYPGAGNTDGRPNKALVYDWALNKWSHGSFEVEIICQSITPSQFSVDFDAGGAGDEDIDPDPEDNLSYDTDKPEAAALTLGGYDSTFKIGKFDGAALVATFETGDIEVTPGRHSLVSNVRPIVEGQDRVKVAIAPKMRSGKLLPYTSWAGLDSQGTCNVRRDARYHRLKMQVGETNFTGFTRAAALEVNYKPTGTR